MTTAQPSTSPAGSGPLPTFNTDALVLALSMDASLAEFSAIVEADPAMTSAVLRAANSAVSSPTNPVPSAKEAIVRIGTDEARRVAIGAAISGPLKGLELDAVDLDEMWRHLLTVGLLADASAWRNLSAADGERQGAFTAGVLHDIGRLAMIVERPHAITAVKALTLEGADPRDAERLIFGYDHAEHGRALAQQWGLPDELTIAIGAHHEGGESPLAVAVHEGRAVAHSLGIGDGLNTPPTPGPIEDPTARATLGQLGGPSKLAQRVDWYRSALAG